MLNFLNEGELDLRTALTFGVSAKETENPIGQFGTGLKYAIAIFLNTSHDVRAYIGNDTYVFSVEDMDFRGSTYRRATMSKNGGDFEPLGFTTHMGEHWPMWAALREMYCNARDEPGWYVCESDAPIDSEREGHTLFTIDGPDIHELWAMRGEYFLHDSKPLNSFGVVNVHSLKENGIFYKGVRVCTDKTQKYSYNITEGHLPITEDRTCSNNAQARWLIEDSFGIHATDPSLISDILTCDDDSWEAGWATDLSRSNEAFKEIVAGILSDPLKKVPAKLALHYAKSGLTKALTLFDLDEMQRKMLARSLEFLEAAGFPGVADTPFTFVETLGAGVQARVKNGRVYVARECFNKGTRYLTSTLLEEHVHLTTGYNDYTPNLQTHLFDLVITMAERLAGEPL